LHFIAAGDPCEEKKRNQVKSLPFVALAKKSGVGQ
jgi:hypothetical protein